MTRGSSAVKKEQVYEPIGVGGDKRPAPAGALSPEHKRRPQVAVERDELGDDQAKGNEVNDRRHGNTGDEATEAEYCC